jgi:hypothetical protein
MSIKSAIKISGLTVLALLLVFAALGPAKFQVRSGLGWRIDHFVGYFALTLTVSLAWPRPLLVGGVLTATAIMLEGLQSLTPDRLCDLQGAFYSAGGVMAAMLPADVAVLALGRLHERTPWPAAYTRGTTGLSPVLCLSVAVDSVCPPDAFACSKPFLPQRPVIIQHPSAHAARGDGHSDQGSRISARRILAGSRPTQREPI